MSEQQPNVGGIVPKPPEPRPEAEIMAGWEGDVDSPLVSILCATYNHANYIEDAIKGFLCQDTGFPFEIIIADDASTDGTKEIVERYAAKFPRIIKPIFHFENQYSQGFRPPRYFKKLIKGRYCALCEGDDYWVDSKKLRLQVEGLERNPNVDLSIHPAYMLDVERQKATLMYEHGDRELILPVAAPVASMSQFSPTASYVFRTEAFLSMPTWFFEAIDLPFGDYFVEAIIGRPGILYFPDALSVYRRNVPGSYTAMTKQAEETQLLERLKSILAYTRKLSVFSEIPKSALEIRLKMVLRDYINMAIYRKSHSMLIVIAEIADSYEVPFGKRDQLLVPSRVLFCLYAILKRAKGMARQLIKA
ncbi:glycosyltransferase [Alcanivorax sp.]|jgi:glycosyltransferase involved in cell wall biosynthesis|uniref:glycosyltransferase family 2 protein n=1 Tax=Alcanivorax sp. TaxID=1872427 RepID=UPI0032D9A04E